MYCTWSMILQASKESPVPAVDCHCMYMETRACLWIFWRKYFPIDIYSVKDALKISHWLLFCVPSTQGFQGMQRLYPQHYASCLAWRITLYTSLLSNATGGNLLHLHSVLMLQWKLRCWQWIQERLAKVNDRIEQAAVMGQNQHTGRIKWDNVCESAYKLEHTDKCSNDTAGDTS